MEIPLTPIARSRDPLTSQNAGDEHTVLGKRANRARQVLELVAKHPGSTTGELSRYFFEAYPDLPFRVAAETPHKRCSDLENLDLVRKGQTRKCSDSGTEALTWYLTDRGRRELGLGKQPEEQGELF